MLEKRRLQQDRPDKSGHEQFPMDVASSSSAQLQETGIQTGGSFLYGPAHLIARGTSLPYPPDQVKEKQVFPGFVYYTCCVLADEIPKLETATIEPVIILEPSSLFWKAKRRPRKWKAFLYSLLTLRIIKK